MRSSIFSSDGLYPAVRLPWGARGIVLSLALVGTVWFVGDHLLGRGCESLVLWSRLRFSRIYDGSADANVLFLGDSRAVNTFYVPAIDSAYGTKSLNLGYNGCSAAIAVMLFEDYLDHNVAPKTVVLEVTCARQRGDLLKSLKMYAGTSRRLAEALREESPGIAVAIGVTRLYAFNSEMFLRALYYLVREDQAWVNGYTIQPSLLQKAIADSETTLALVEATVDNTEAIRRLVTLCRERGIRVAGVLGPYLPAHARRLENLEAWKAELSDRTGLDILDLSSGLSDNGQFADTLHTNHAGAMAIVPMLGRVIVGDGEFKSSGVPR